jgi:hypothetical protein
MDGLGPQCSAKINESWHYPIFELELQSFVSMAQNVARQKFEIQIVYIEI